MPGVYFTALFAGQPFLVNTISTERGRDIVVQSPANGDIHTLADQGKRVWKSTYEVLFCQRPGQADYLERYEQFRDLCHDGDAHELVDPLDGSFVVRAESFAMAHDSESLMARVTVTFLEERNAPPVFPSAAGVDVGAGLESVTTAVDRTTNILDEFDLEDSPFVPSSALAEVERWTELADLGTLDSQDVFLGVSSLTAQIDSAIEVMDLKSQLDQWPVYREMIQLRYEIVRAGAALTSDADSLLEVFVAVPRPVLAICAEVYGAELARQRATEVTKINRIRTPGRVPAGTTLKMPSAGAS